MPKIGRKIGRIAIAAGLAAAFTLLALSSALAVGAGKRCGGIIGIPCDAGMFCQLKAGHCGAADMFGTCARVPRFCTRIYLPVCGCDGKTYGNDCQRMTVKVQKDHNGRCRRAS